VLADRVAAGGVDRRDDAGEGLDDLKRNVSRGGGAREEEPRVVQDGEQLVDGSGRGRLVGEVAARLEER
jgi:hypothetical protein